MPARIDFLAEQKTAMLIAYLGGRSFLDISKAFGCSKTRIRDELLRLGAEPDRGRSISSKMKGQPSRRLGARWSDEAKERISRARKGCAPTRTGPHSEATKAKISAATRGKNTKWTDDERAALERVRQSAKRFLHRCLRGAEKPSHLRTNKALGYTPLELARHLGAKPCADAHIDHYVPIVEFFRRGITAPEVINALANLRWMPADANRLKSSKVPEDVEDVIALCLTATFKEGRVFYSPGLA